MLDALMGGDRNAPLPSGAAVKKGITTTLQKKEKSCYDADICPLYCAWNGIDVYELFVNTKSDIGGNPKSVSDSANREYQRLPKHEQERLGFEYLLFRKLQDLVRMCDRTVARNKEKLVQEKRGKGTAHIDYVTTVDERAVEHACRTKIDLEKITNEIQEKERELEKVMEQEAKLQQQYQDEQREKKKGNEEAVASMGSGDEKKEEGGETGSKNQESSKENGDTQDPTEAGESSKEPSKKDYSNHADTDATPDAKPETDSAPSQTQEEDDDASPLKMEMQELLLKRQRLLFDLARAMQHYAPIQQAMEQQMEQLNIVKSDITSDKTVCEVSGNFMSARDADERIAAHYAGKQYVGWKLVRDKLKEMIAEYGRYGPPQGESGAAKRGSSGGVGGDGYGGGRGGDRYGPNDGGRWERGGRGYNDNRRGGSYRDGRGGGGYNRGYYGGGGDYQRYGGGGGGRDRWRRQLGDFII